MENKGDLYNAAQLICSNCKDKKCKNCKCNEIINQLFCYKKGLGNLQAWKISYTKGGWSGYQVIVILAEDEEHFNNILYNNTLLDKTNTRQYAKDMREAKRLSEYGGSGAFWDKKYCTDDKTIDTLINHCFDGNVQNADSGIYLLPFVRTQFGSDHLWD